MNKIILFILVVFLAGCKTSRTVVEVPKILYRTHTDTIYKTAYRADTIRQTDSIIIRQNGTDRVRYISITTHRVDTIRQTIRDTIERPVTVQKTVEVNKPHRPKWYEGLLQWIGGAVAAVWVVVILIFIIRMCLTSRG